jgi:peptide/nickel transport system permease protein
LRKLVSDRLGVFSLAMIAILIFVAIFGPHLAPYDPYKIDPKNTFDPPSRAHPMGTDEMGRDIFSRVIYGTRVSILVGFAVTIAGAGIGVLLGTLAGLAGGIVDEAVMRVTDIFIAIPLLILAMAITAVLGPSMVNAAIAMSIVWWPGYARQARAETIRLKNALYVEAARAVGVSGPRLILRHILPNGIDPILVRMTTTIGYVMLTTAALSFIGLGTRPPKADWGTMVSVARRYLMSYPWYPLLVGLPLFLTVVFFALAGDAIQDAMGVHLDDT